MPGTLSKSLFVSSSTLRGLFFKKLVVLFKELIVLIISILVGLGPGKLSRPILCSIVSEITYGLVVAI